MTLKREPFEKENHVEVMSIWNEETGDKIVEKEKDNLEKTGHAIELFSCGDIHKNPEVIIRIVHDNHDIGVITKHLDKK